MTFEQLMREPRHLLLKSISGSRAYNLSLPTSDTDIKGVFVLPQSELYGLSYTEQVNNDSHDEVFFEVGRLIELLCKNNPNILELLSTPADCVLFRHPLMELIRPEDFLSRLCMDAFAGYATTQIKKARGLNKKMNQHFERERRSVLDFCHVVQGTGMITLSEWLSGSGVRQEDCGLVKLDHFRDGYLLYHGATGVYSGIVSGLDANDVQLSTVPVEAVPVGIMHFNKDAYSVYCKEYASYWQWVEERNEDRYLGSVAHGKNYDAKHMMHTIRLLTMAEEIARYRRVVVHREDRAFLLRVKTGEFAFEELMRMVEEKMEVIRELYTVSDLPDRPDEGKAEEVLIRVREGWYGK